MMANWLRHLDAHRFEPHLAVLRHVGTRLASLPSYVPIHDLGASRARQAIIPLARLCWRLKPRAVVSTCTHVNAAAVAARPLLPKRTALLVREGSDIFARTPGRIRLFLYRQAYRRADAVLCQSDHMQARLIDRFDLSPAKAIRLYNPVDTELITALARAEEKPFAHSGPNLLAVGRLYPEKGIDLLLRCMPLVQAAMPDAFLTIVGNGPDLPALRKLLDELAITSCVKFVGRRRNPYPLIREADLLVLPSRSEGLPNVVLEAIALGTPVVATNCSGALQEIASCCPSMHIANERTPAAVAREIISSLTDGGGAATATPSAEFAARFGLRAVITQLEELLCRSMGVKYRGAATYADKAETFAW